MNIKKIFVGLSLVILTAGFAGANDFLQQLLNRLETADKNIHTLQFTFTQEVTIGKEVPATSISGRLYFREPDQIRLEQGGKNPQIIIGNGKKFWLYDSRTRQALETDISPFGAARMFKSGGSLSSLPLGNWSNTRIKDLEKDYVFSAAEIDTATVCLTINPRQDKEKLAPGFNLRLYFREPALVPEKNVLTLDTGDGPIITTMFIYDWQPNKKLSDGLFRLPAGSEVIKP